MGCWCSVFRSHAQRPVGAVRGRPLSAPALPTSGHGSSVRVALFSLVRCPAAPRLHTRTGKPKEACHLEQAS